MDHLVKAQSPFIGLYTDQYGPLSGKWTFNVLIIYKIQAWSTDV